MALDIEQQIEKLNHVWSDYPYIRIIAITILVYLAGFFNFSIFYAIAFSIIWASSHYKSVESQSKKLELQYARLHMNPDLVKKICNGTLPSWITFPDWEKSKFLNHILEVWWPYLKVATEDTIRSSVDPILEYYKPSFLTKLKFGIINLGDVTPQILAVKSYSRDDAGEDVILDLELAVQGGDREVTLTAGNMLVSLQAALRDIEITGRFRVVFSRLSTEWPAFIQMRLCFCEKPKLNYKLQAVKIPLSRIPGFVPWLTKLIQSILDDYLVFPNEIVINLDDWWETEEQIAARKAAEQMRESKRMSMALRPKGMLQVRVIEASNLKNTEIFGKIDPICKIWIDKPKSVTKKCHNTMNPVWNESFEFTILDLNTQTLKIDVQNFNFARKNDKLGHLNINLSKLVNGEQQQGWYELDDAKGGKIHLQMQYVRLGASPLIDQTELAQLLADVNDTDSNSEAESSELEEEPAQPRAHSAGATAGVGGSGDIAVLQASRQRPEQLEIHSDRRGVVITSTTNSQDHDANKTVTKSKFFKRMKSPGGSEIASEGTLINADGDISRSHRATMPSLKLGNETPKSAKSPKRTATISGIASSAASDGTSMTETSISPEKKIPKVSKMAKAFKRQKSSLTAERTGFTDCILQVKVIKGIDLMAADSNGLSDPYVSITFLDIKQKTTIKQKTLNPVWNEAFSFKINSEQVKDDVEKAVVKIKVKDHDNWGKNDDIGSLDISVSDILMNGGSLVDTYTLQGVKTGQLQVKLQLLVGTGSKLERSISITSGDEIKQSIPQIDEQNEIRISDPSREK